MFYFDSYLNQKVLKSDYLNDINAFFTTKQQNLFVFENKRIVTPTQTHSANVEVIDSRNEYPDTDGLICNTNDIIYYLRFADCTPIIMYDSKNKISAISHAGWRGTASMIGVKTYEKMNSLFGTKPKDVIAVIGPAISMCCYEVSQDVKEKLLSTIKNQSNVFCDNNVNLKEINAQQLREVGITRIDICPYCTACDNDLFYSYRKEKATPNRHYAVIMQ